MSGAEQQAPSPGPDPGDLRARHQVRLVSAAEEGTGLEALPGGVYGFTYSPGLPNAPLFAGRRYRTFETHKLASGEICVIGFAEPAEAARLTVALEDVTIHLRAQPEPGIETPVVVPYSRIRRHRRVAAPNQEGFTVTLAPAFAAAAT